MSAEKRSQKVILFQKRKNHGEKSLNEKKLPHLGFHKTLYPQIYFTVKKENIVNMEVPFHILEFIDR